ncbi:MAG: mucoidy inhibitor MuiA family protein [Phycisphaeraceae bacterium]|nr:mucoidy inhibitor MuiA family protein [Phycisphaeraceae bacterium]
MSIAASAHAQVEGPRSIDIRTLKVDAPITAVTVYQGRAAITRTTTVSLEQGAHALHFVGLPASIRPETLQARSTPGATLTNVEYLEQPVAADTGSPAMVALDAEIQSLRIVIERLAEDRSLTASQARLLDQIGTRVSSDATRDLGNERLDLGALQSQLEFVHRERTRLVEADRALADRQREVERSLKALEARRAAMGRGGSVERCAEVTLAVPQSAEVTVSLTYLVTNAGWVPAYSVRAATDRSAVSIEFDASLLQQSGEDWNDVALTISTAQPTLRADPPTLTPLLIGVIPPPPPPSPTRSAVSSERLAAAPAPGGAAHDSMAFAKNAAELEAWSGGAAVVDGGTAVSFELPRRISVPSNADRRTRTRVATIAPKATFVHTAVPLLTDAVYLRSRLINESPYQLIPGPAQVFMGSEYVGTAPMGLVAPGGECIVDFGIDRSIRAVRTLVSKITSETGVFSKSRETTRRYRIVIENGSGRPIGLEVLDRRPVSQDERITVTTEGLTRPLSTDPEYLRDEAPMGILRWDLSVPATSTGANAMTVEWTTKVSAPRDLRISEFAD